MTTSTLPKKRKTPSKSGKTPPTDMERFTIVCNLVAQSRIGTFKACEAVGVDRNAFYALLASSEEARDIYARSKSVQVEGLVDEMVEIADAPVATTEHGYDSADVQNKRVRIDTRKWLASKLLPKKYGDHLDITSDGKALAQPPAQLSYKIVEGRVAVGSINAAD